MIALDDKIISLIYDSLSADELEVMWRRKKEQEGPPRRKLSYNQKTILEYKKMLMKKLFAPKDILIKQ